MSDKRFCSMLLQFKFKNYKCFYDETILDLTATGEKRHINTTIDINGNKILPVIEINGANASGKSGILEALGFMFNLIKTSSRVDINKELPTNPFAFSTKARNQNSEFEISICLKDYEYRYGFAVNKDEFAEDGCIRRNLWHLLKLLKK